MANSPFLFLGAEVNRTCNGPTRGTCTKCRRRRHAPCNGGVAKQAATFPNGPNRAIIRVAKKHLKLDTLRAANMGWHGSSAANRKDMLARVPQTPRYGKDEPVGVELRDRLLEKDHQEGKRHGGERQSSVGEVYAA